MGKIALRLVGKRLQKPDLDDAAHPSTCFCGLLEAIQEAHGVVNGELIRVAVVVARPRAPSPA